MAEKLSVLFDLDLLFNDETLRRFVQLSHFKRCFEYLVEGKDVVAVLTTGLALANLCSFSVYRISCLSRWTIIFCKIHEFYTSWHLYICRFLFGHPTILSLHSCLWRALHAVFFYGVIRKIKMGRYCCWSVGVTRIVRSLSVFCESFSMCTFSFSYVLFLTSFAFYHIN